MATLLQEGESYRVHLGSWERLGALRGDLVIPRSSVVDIRMVPDVVAEIRGIRAPGYGLPGHAAVGTWRGRGFKDFVAVSWRQRRGVVITLSGQEFDRVVLSSGPVVEVAQRMAPAV
ncbi:MAG TPA: hypothetical protein VMI11_07020 [Actinomycetes bacterium]|nr:hypothetical protein [Actinomycetes bacterium]